MQLCLYLHTSGKIMDEHSLVPRERGRVSKKTVKSVRCRLEDEFFSFLVITCAVVLLYEFL